MESYLPSPTAAKPAEKEKSFFTGLRVSLMPAELGGGAPPDLRRSLIILVAVLLIETVIVGLAAIYIRNVADSRAAKLEAAKKELQQLLAATVEKEATAADAVAFNSLVAANVAALDGHVYWTRFFLDLEKYVLPQVHCVTLSGDSGTGLVNLDCTAPTYHDVAQQIVLMRQHPAILEVRTNSASASVDKKGTIASVGFSMALRLKTSAWLAEEKGKPPIESVMEAERAPSAPLTPSLNGAPVVIPDEPATLSADEQ